ncbi:MAG: hypothetical protein Q8Q74_10755 [Polaromonas sp.]|nr:hypothetical protein [Polaromonas sp.]
MNTSRLLKILAAVAIVFGVLTVFSGGRALFGGTEARVAVGNAVDFVLWFNFLAGFAYVLSGFGLWRGRRWAAWAASLLALATASSRAPSPCMLRVGVPMKHARWVRWRSGCCFGGWWPSWRCVY